MTSAQRRSRLDDLPFARHSARAPLSRDEIVAAAIRIADSEGLAAVTMRRLGHELGAGATSLYWHILNKDQLCDLMVDALLGEVATAVVPTDGWRDGLAELARALRRVLIRHRSVAPLLVDRPMIGPHSLDVTERVVDLLRQAGFDDRTTSLASGSLIDYASGSALFETRSPGDPSRTPEAARASARSLPDERRPNLLAVAAVPIGEGERFEYGLQRLLDGFEADLDLSGADRPELDEPGVDRLDDERPVGPSSVLLL